MAALLSEMTRSVIGSLKGDSAPERMVVGRTGGQQTPERTHIHSGTRLLAAVTYWIFPVLLDLPEQRSHSLSPWSTGEEWGKESEVLITTVLSSKSGVRSKNIRSRIMAVYL